MRLYSKQQPIDLIASMIKRDRLCHSFILTGEEGVGKRTLADYMAMQILCRSKSGLPCHSCKDCKMAENSAHPDIIKVAPSGKSGNYKVDDLRPLTADASVASNEGGYKIYIIAGIDKALAAAQNILLKIFEEPPDHVIFIMTAQDKQSVLPTVLSRAVVINVPQATKEDCLTALKDFGFSPELCRQAYNICGGSIGKCLEYLNDKKAGNISAVGNIAEALVKGDEYILTKLLCDAAEDRENFLALLCELSQLILTACAVKQGGEAMERYSKAASELADSVRLRGLMSMYESIGISASKIGGNAQPALTAAGLSAGLTEAALR